MGPLDTGLEEIGDQVRLAPLGAVAGGTVDDLCALLQKSVCECAWDEVLLAAEIDTRQLSPGGDVDDLVGAGEVLGLQ